MTKKTPMMSNEAHFSDVFIEIDDDIYTCNICGFSEKWDETDERFGDMWSCEKCGKIFCSKCLIDVIGYKCYMKIMQGSNFITCPDCTKIYK